MRRTLWRTTLALLTGGVLLQTSSCTGVAATSAATLTASIANEFIRDFVSEWLGVTGTGF